MQAMKGHNRQLQLHAAFRVLTDQNIPERGSHIQASQLDVISMPPRKDLHY